MINKIEFTKNELKTFTKIYASNWNHVPRIFNPNDYQGKGIGSQLLGKALREVADVKKLPVVLSTQDPRNVIFYSRL